MEISRAYEILNNKRKVEVFYNNRPVWIQELKSSKDVLVGCIDNFEEKIVQIEDIYEQ